MGSIGYSILEKLGLKHCELYTWIFLQYKSIQQGENKIKLKMIFQNFSIALMPNLNSYLISVLVLDYFDRGFFFKFIKTHSISQSNKPQVDFVHFVSVNTLFIVQILDFTLQGCNS